MTTTVRIDKSEDSEIWTVTIDRPEVRNAVDGPTARDRSRPRRSPSSITAISSSCLLAK